MDGGGGKCVFMSVKRCLRGWARELAGPLWPLQPSSGSHARPIALDRALSLPVEPYCIPIARTDNNIRFLKAY